MDASGQAWHKGEHSWSTLTSRGGSIQMVKCPNRWIAKGGCSGDAPRHGGPGAIDSDELNMWMDARHHGMDLRGGSSHWGRAKFEITIRLT